MTPMDTAPSRAGLVAALDVGGTKIAGALVDAEGRILLRARRPTPAAADGATVMAAAAEVLGDLRDSPRWAAVEAVGIGSAGPVDRAAGAVSPVNIPGWRGYPLRERVRELTGGLPVELIGDGAAVAAAEHWVGAARNSSHALCMVVSTGVGGGLVLGGRVRPGRTGNAGHIGHISVDLDGDPCPCGGRGCVEGLARGPAIARRARENGWRPEPGGEGSAAEVAAAARDGHPAAVAAFARAGRALAAAIAGVAALVEIEVAVVGGGVAEAGEVLFAPLRQALPDYATLAFTRDLRVVPALTGPDAGLIGAAAAALGRLDG
ncbi:ROK family protein [Streptomyces sp. NPDC002734]|uniref:ROK family protein n=1 Tax=Streptomyces sp. NPDC002734 TaxID=3154426 RepID=UPI00331F45B7